MCIIFRTSTFVNFDNFVVLYTSATPLLGSENNSDVHDGGTSIYQSNPSNKGSLLKGLTISRHSSSLSSRVDDAKGVL